MLLLLLFWLLPVLLAKKRALVIGIDGLNPSLILNATSNQNFLFLKSIGSSTFQARTTIQTMSGPGWSSIICSLDPTDTGILNNEWLPPWDFKANNITPITGNKAWFPCVFENLKKQNGELKTAFYYDWDWLRYLGNKFMKGGFIDDEVFCNGVDLNSTLKCDNENVEITLKKIAEDDFDFLLLYLNGLDETGHKYNWGSREYEAEIGLLDFYLGKIINALKSRGIFDETYILVTSDHGGRPGVNYHGEKKDSNIFVPWILVGPNIKKNYEIIGNVHNMDSMPSLMKALGYNSHQIWRGNSVDEVFEGYLNDEFLN